jgi:hypothetical protein
MADNINGTSTTGYDDDNVATVRRTMMYGVMDDNVGET